MRKIIDVSVLEEIINTSYKNAPTDVKVALLEVLEQVLYKTEKVLDPEDLNNN